MRAVPAVAALLVGCLGVTACGSGTERPDGRLRVEAAFYPLQWVSERVGGRFVAVHGMTPPGAEPHDLELSPRAVGAVQDADLAVYLSGFQPSVDDAVEGSDGTVFDARDVAALDLASPRDAGGEGGGNDPHFWLDPTRLARVASGVATALADLDPAHRAQYRANARAVEADLRSLDRDLAAALWNCRNRDLVTTHSAFGYLANRYGFGQVGINGINAEGEPSPRELARVATYVEDHHVQTVYVEPLVSSAAARTVAEEAGVRVAVLDPIEGIDDRSAGDDYLSIMRANLRTLVKGQSCR